MGNPCSSGSGAANPGSGVVAFLTNLAVAAFLTRLNLGWLAAVAGALPQFAFDVETFCTDGQPDLPEITAEDVLALANPLLNPGNSAAALKLRDLVLHYLWFELCHCEDVLTPAPPAVQDPPDVIGYGQPGETACMTSPSCDQNYHYDFIFGSGPLGGLWWAANSSTVPCYADSTTANPRTVRLVLDRVRSGSGEHEDPFHFIVTFQHVFSATPSDIIDVFAPGDHFDGTFTVPVGATAFHAHLVPGLVETQPDHSNDDDIFTGQSFGYCDTVPNGPTGGCCPPDAGLIDAINALKADLALVKTQADLIQRQAVPFAWVEGETYFPLTGNGRVEFSTPVLGVRLQLSEVPDRIGIEVGDTYEVFTNSWVNWENGFNPQPRIWLRGYTQLSFPPAAGAMTAMSYTLEPGLSIAIVELVREP